MADPKTPKQTSNATAPAAAVAAAIAEPQPLPKAMAQVPTALARKIQPMETSRIKGREFLSVDWMGTANAGVEPQDLLDPAYWAHVANQLKPWNQITVLANDGAWMAELVVLDVSRAWARVHMKACHRFTTADVSASQAAQMMSPYDVVYRGPHEKWSVVRRADNQVVHDQEETQEGAVTWLRERVKVEAR